MSAPFDPYHIWLGISPKEQPPNHYRLLGIRLFEDKPEVIDSAADRQMGHLRTFQAGEYSALSQQLLNEVAKARVTLLSAEKRTAYDRELKAKFDAKKPKPAIKAAPAGAKASQPAEASDADAIPLAVVAEAVIEPIVGEYRATRPWRRRSAPQWSAIVGAVAGVLILLAVLVVMLTPGGDRPVAEKTPRGGTDAGSRPNVPPVPPAAVDPRLAKVGSEMVDLLPLVDPGKHKGSGHWQTRPSGLEVVERSSRSQIYPPVIPKGSFEWEVEFTRSEGHGSIALLFPVGASFAHVEVSGFDGQFSGLGNINGCRTNDSRNPTMRPSSVANNVRHKMALRVQLSKDNQDVDISAVIDGGEFVRWKGRVSELSIDPAWGVRQAKLGLAADYSRVLFHSARLRMLDAKAKVLTQP